MSGSAGTTGETEESGARIADLLVQVGLLQAPGSTATEPTPAHAADGTADNALEITKKARTLLLVTGAGGTGVSATGAGVSAARGVEPALTTSLVAATVAILVAWWITRAWVSAADVRARSTRAAAALQARAVGFACLVQAGALSGTGTSDGTADSLSRLSLAEMLLHDGTAVTTTGGLNGTVQRLRWDADGGLHFEVAGGNGKDLAFDDVREAMRTP